MRGSMSQDGEINSFLALSRERAMAQAAKIDAMAAKGEALPALAGVPVGIKDVLVMQGAPATAGSLILKGYRPPYDATVVTKLEAAGAVLLGKLNCDEFAMGSSNENSAYGPVLNPRALDRVPGGSSGGSAAAVAADFAVATLGTDTGGSIRQPAAFCGVVGVLPTYGRVSRYGLIAFASSLDRVGPLTKNVKDAATVLQVIAGQRCYGCDFVGSSGGRLCWRAGEAGGGASDRRAGGVLWRGAGSGDSRLRLMVFCWSEDGGMRGEAGQSAAHKVRDPDLLRDCDGGGFVEPVAVRWGAVRVQGGGGEDALGDVPEDAG